MQELSDIELEMILVMARYYPFDIAEITDVYRRLESFDKTIETMKLTMLFNITLNEMANQRLSIF